jgi:hypothetical protein
MMSPAARDGYVAAKTAHIGPPSESPNSTARSELAASITARTSSMRVSMLGMLATRSDRPVPRLSKRMSRQKDARWLRNPATAGCSQKTSMLDTQPGTSTRSVGPSPTTW